MVAFRLEHAVAHESACIRHRITEPFAIFLQPIFIELVSILLYRIQVDFRSDRTLRIRDPAIDHVENSRVNLQCRQRRSVRRCLRHRRFSCGSRHGRVSLVAADRVKWLNDLGELGDRNSGCRKSVESAEDRMRVRAFASFVVHIGVVYPIRNNLGLAAVLALWPVNQIHRTEGRFDFSFFRVLLISHDVSVADAFSRWLDGECRVPPISILDCVKWQRMVLIFILLDLVVRDLDILQPESLRQIGRNVASDLQLL